jgi:mannitol/fructose-specific phosphotransferase system IIA component (Ntr-type)
MQVGGIIGYGFLLWEMGKEALLISSILIAGSLFVYWFYGRIRATREYALLYLIERITAKELTTHSLETELKEIIRERDDIIRDRFDRVIEESIIMDVEKTIEVKEFFQSVAQAMSEKIKIPPEVILRELIEREKGSTTVTSPSVAIPHVITEGEYKFSILLARCREGILFSKDAPRVEAVFVLVGTKEERNFHLRALASIAQIVQDPHFEKKWMAAKNKEALRDIVLLGRRRRH